MVVLFLRCIDDTVSSQALAVLTALVIPVPEHYSVFLFDDTTILSKESQLTDPLIAIITAGISITCNVTNITLPSKIPSTIILRKMMNEWSMKFKSLNMRPLGLHYNDNTIMYESIYARVLYYQAILVILSEYHSDKIRSELLIELNIIGVASINHKSNSRHTMSSKVIPLYDRSNIFLSDFIGVLEESVVGGEDVDNIGRDDISFLNNSKVRNGMLEESSDSTIRDTDISMNGVGLSTTTTTVQLQSQMTAYENIKFQQKQLACQCLLAIINLADEDDEDPNVQIQMPPFEHLPKLLGLQCNENNGLLVRLLKKELYYLQQCKINEKRGYVNQTDKDSYSERNIEELRVKVHLMNAINSMKSF